MGQLLSELPHLFQAVATCFYCKHSPAARLSASEDFLFGDGRFGAEAALDDGGG